MTKQISLEEVKKHKSEKSLWVIIHNDIYDVTKYLEEHPGGVDPLLEVAGRDGTQEFEDVGHSEDAREILKKFKIGTLSESDRSKVMENCSNLKWAILALAGALVIGIALKKYLG